MKNELNGVFLKSYGIGESFHYGPGAGALPTATSVLADVLTIVDKQTTGGTVSSFSPYQHSVTWTADLENKNAYFISFSPQLERKVSEVQNDLANNFLSVIEQVQEATNQLALYIVTKPLTTAQLEQLSEKLASYGECRQPLQLMEA